jgi:hypothetical protein
LRSNVHPDHADIHLHTHGERNWQLQLCGRMDCHSRKHRSGQ